MCRSDAPRSRVLVWALAALPLWAAPALAELNCPTGPFAPDCSLLELEQQRGSFRIGDVAVDFDNLPGTTVDHSKIRVSSFGEETGNPGVLFEPAEGVWSVASGEEFSDQLLMGATKVSGSQVLGLSAFAWEFDVEAEGSGTTGVTVFVEGTDQVINEQYLVTASPFNPIGGASFPLQPNGAAITLGLSSSASPILEGRSEVRTIRVFFDLPLVSAILPTSRSVEVGGAPGTAFLTGINGGAETGINCGVAPGTSLPADFEFRTTDPLTNEVVGAPNEPVDIGPGGAQSYVVAFTPSTPFPPTDVDVIFNCDNTSPAASVTGLNTLLLSASDTPVADVIALAATINNNGIVKLSSAGAFAVATVNVGAGELLTATAGFGNVSLPLALAICQTDPATGLCLEDPVDGAFGVVTQINSNETPTFGVFVSADVDVPFEPAVNRVFVRFTDPGGAVRGSTSVAVQTLP